MRGSFEVTPSLSCVTAQAKWPSRVLRASKASNDGEELSKAPHRSFVGFNSPAIGIRTPPHRSEQRSLISRIDEEEKHLLPSTLRTYTSTKCGSYYYCLSSYPLPFSY